MSYTVILFENNIFQVDIRMNSTYISIAFQYRQTTPDLSFFEIFFIDLNAYRENNLDVETLLGCCLL